MVKEGFDLNRHLSKFPGKPIANDNKPIYKYSLIIAITTVLAIFTIKPFYNKANTTASFGGSVVINQNYIKNVHTNDDKQEVVFKPVIKGEDFVYWSDLAKEDKKIIINETIEKFPEIKELGSGVNWRPITMWLAQEKGIIYSLTRDIFRPTVKRLRNES